MPITPSRARRVTLRAALALAAPAALAAPPAAAAAAPAPTVQVTLTTAGLGRALTRMPDLRLSRTAPSGRLISVEDGARGQRIRGFGAAMTNTSAWLIEDKLSPATRAALMKALFGPTGIGLRFLRVPMGASDFTATGTPYSYDDVPAGQTDPGLAGFSIAVDDAFVLPALQQAVALDPSLFVLANPWSPPAWMKSNDALSNLGGAGRWDPSAAGPLAAYFVAFLRAYARAGIHVQALTPQNEPGQGSIYPGMNMSEPEEAAFVDGDLVPALDAAGLHPEIYGYDWGWPANQIAYAHVLARSAAARNLAGIATHCYRGNPTAVAALHREAPQLEEIVDECSPGLAPAPTAEVAIASMRNWASTLALWNVALDPRGGPVQPPNYGCPRCTGVVTVDERSHGVTYTPDYYELGQLSKFVLPGAVRLGSNHFVSYVRPTKHRSMATAGLDDAAFQNPDGSHVVVAYNNSSAPIPFAVQDGGWYFGYRLPARATATFVWKARP